MKKLNMSPSKINRHLLLRLIEPAIYGALAILLIGQIMLFPIPAIIAWQSGLLLIGTVIGNFAICGWRPITAWLIMKNKAATKADIDTFLDLAFSTNYVILDDTHHVDTHKQAA